MPGPPRADEAGGLAMGLAVGLVEKPEPEPKLLSPWPLPRLPGWTALVKIEV